jgi:hypothetical protein
LVDLEGQRQATRWVQEAIRSEQFRFVEGDKKFPKHIWYEADGCGWFGLCVNSEAGHYKGWPMNEEERGALFR